MNLRVNNQAAQPSFGKLIWRYDRQDSTCYAISEIMRTDKNGQGKLSFNTLQDQFEKIDGLDEDVIVNCSCSGDGIDGIFSLFARNKSGTLLADTTIFLADKKQKVDKLASSFADDVSKKLQDIKKVRNLSPEQQEYYNDAKAYMREFDTKA